MDGRLGLAAVMLRIQIPAIYGAIERTPKAGGPVPSHIERIATRPKRWNLKRINQYLG